jgi:hypothetical protein
LFASIIFCEALGDMVTCSMRAIGMDSCFSSCEGEEGDDIGFACGNIRMLVTLGNWRSAVSQILGLKYWRRK